MGVHCVVPGETMIDESPPRAPTENLVEGAISPIFETAGSVLGRRIEFDDRVLTLQV